MAGLYWESVRQEGSTFGRLRRAKVPGGWLLIHALPEHPATLAFLPDAEHQWDVELEADHELPVGRGWDRR